MSAAGGGRRRERVAGGLPLAAVASVVTAGVLPVYLVGSVAVQLRAELGFAETAQGSAIAVFFLAAAAGSAAFGRMAERLGAVRSLRLAAAGSVAALLLGAAAPDVTVLMGSLVVGGLANALAQPAANLWIARSVARRRLGLAFAVKQAGVPGATLLGGLLVPTIALTLGWRAAFVAGAAVAATGGLAVGRGRGASGHGPPGAGGAASAPAERAPTRLGPTVADARSDGGSPHDVDRSGAGTVPDQRGPAEAEASRTVPPGARPELRPLLVLAVAIGLGSAQAGALGGFLVSALVDAGAGEGAAGGLVAAGSALGITVRLVSGQWADRRDGGHLKVVARMLGLGTLAYVGLASGSLPLMVAAVPAAFGLAWGWPGLFNLAVVREHPDAAGRASGITQTGTYLGAVAGPLAFGLLAEGAGYPAAWGLAGALCAASSVGMVIGRATLLRARARRQLLAAGPVPA